MKKSLVMLTVLAVSLAFVGVALAGSVVPCPAPFEVKMVPAKMGPAKPLPGAKVPLPGKIAGPKVITPKCGPCIPCPGAPYAKWEKQILVPVVKKVDVYQDLCRGKTKGKCFICGPCSPEIKWACKWKTAMICGQAEVVTMRPQTVEYKFPVVCKPKPCPPPDCF